MNPARLLLIGHGRMGRLVETLAPEYGFAVGGTIDEHTDAAAEWPAADVAFDFSGGAGGPANGAGRARRGTPIVIGTTGWHGQESEVRDSATGIGVVAAPNFAIGVNLFLAVTARLGRLMAQQPAFGAWIHELHHAAKKDAPSGTALAMDRRLRDAGYRADVPIASTRAGAIPGTHTLGFDSASETITLTHQARDRAAFARGSLVAARWIIGKKGWFSMADVLGLEEE